MPREVRGSQSPDVCMKLDKHLSRIIQQKFILPQDRESKLDPSSLAMHKSYVKEKIRKKIQTTKSHREPELSPRV